MRCFRLMAVASLATHVTALHARVEVKALSGSFRDCDASNPFGNSEECDSYISVTMFYRYPDGVVRADAAGADVSLTVLNDNTPRWNSNANPVCTSDVTSVAIRYAVFDYDDPGPNDLVSQALVSPTYTPVSGETRVNRTISSTTSGGTVWFLVTWTVCGPGTIPTCLGNFLLCTPTFSPTDQPTTAHPTPAVTHSPTASPTASPTDAPTNAPTAHPTTAAPTATPTATPTSVPTTCGHALASLPISPNGVVLIPPGLGGCSPYTYAALPGVLGASRLPSTTTSLRLAGPGLSDPTVPSRFAALAQDLSGLQLDLSGHSYTVLPAAAFAAFGGTLLRLDLSGGTLQVIASGAFNGLVNLRRLALAGNAVATLGAGWLSGAPQLNVLDLANNRLSQITTSTFAGASPGLTEIDLSRNDIVSMSPVPFAAQSNLATVFAFGNPIFCGLSGRGNGIVGPIMECVGCSPSDASNRTLFRPGSVDGNTSGQCVVPESSRLDVVLAGQYVPQGSTLTLEDPSDLSSSASLASTASTFFQYNRTMWPVDRPLRIAPPNITEAVIRSTVSNASGISVDLTTLSFVLDPLPRGFFIDTETGELLGQVEQPATFLSTLYTLAPGAGNATVVQINFTFLEIDTDNPANGPNGRDCASPQQQVDTVPFDRAFTCDCTATADTNIGPNCETVVAAAAASGGSSTDAFTSTPFIAAASAVGFLVLCAIFVSRYQVYKARRRPEDLGALQSEILSSLGVGCTLDIRPDEFGISLQCSGLSDMAASELDGVEREIRRALKEFFPTYSTTKRLDLNNAQVKAVKHENRVILVFRVPARKVASKDAIEGATLAVLQSLITSKHLALSNGFKVNDAGVAIPRRVPREVPRGSVTRVSILGEGNYAEVVKCQVTERDRGIPPYPVAAKIAKTAKSDARDDLLKEAALMAMLEHPHIVSLIGVVTVPRDMPPLLLLAYCEHGTLADYVTKDSELTMVALLSCCADVCLGLRYLSSRLIVHRDVAARNVLLDSQLVCMVADFGMSSALGGGSESSTGYAETYVRLGGELPVRWASVEVLAEGKFSRASDVWAFGCLAYEVFSRGALPYHDKATLMEVSEFVKGGGTMACPEGCPDQIYERVLAPCWRWDSKTRPGFSQLYDELVGLGAISVNHATENAAAESAAPANGAGTVDTVKPKKKKKSAGSIDAKMSLEDRRLLGPSVHHVADVIKPAVLAAVQPPYKDSRGKEVSPPEKATIAHMVEVFAAPAGASMQCPRDGEVGCSYVDTLKSFEHVGRATALLSYTWGYPIASVADALLRWTSLNNRNPKETYIWICSLCLNQHRIGKADVTPEELANEFGPRVRSIGRILPMLEPWRNPVYLTRAWCLFELYTAIGQRGKVNIDIILTEEQHESFVQAMNTEGYDSITNAIGNIHSENATASRDADLEAIRKLVTSTPGGFATLNEVVKDHLLTWFQDQGAVGSARRAMGALIRGPSTETAGGTSGESLDLNTLKNLSLEYAAENGDAVAVTATTEEASAPAITYEEVKSAPIIGGRDPDIVFGFDVEDDPAKLVV